MNMTFEIAGGPLSLLTLEAIRETRDHPPYEAFN